MKKTIIVLSILMFSLVLNAVVLDSNFRFLEPRLLRNGQGKISVGTANNATRYGVLNIMEVGISDFIGYIKLGHNFGDVHFTLGYGQDWRDATVFTGVGLYLDAFYLYGNVFYYEENTFSWIPEEGEERTKSEMIGGLLNFTYTNFENSGDFSILGGYFYDLKNETHNGFSSLVVGSNFKFDWWIFNNIYLYGGLKAEFPFDTLINSVRILAGIETTFQLFN